MESIAYISAVLGYLAGKECTGHGPSIIAKVVLQLHRFNGMLHELERLNAAVGVTWNFEKDPVFLGACEEVKKLSPLGLFAELHFNATTPAGYPGSRLRLELPGTSWDAGDPMYFTAGKTAG
ncbi:hypothetical protein G3A43_07400 [Paraburkholderia aspalathi]|nr:hypothetical protein [Paraburkholderia aspalathi]MBK3780079.1 hypothetical protein [Paraburkholderia aspalathi]